MTNIFDKNVISRLINKQQYELISGLILDHLKSNEPTLKEKFYLKSLLSNYPHIFNNFFSQLDHYEDSKYGIFNSRILLDSNDKHILEKDFIKAFNKTKKFLDFIKRNTKKRFLNYPIEGRRRVFINYADLDKQLKELYDKIVTSFNFLNKVNLIKIQYDIVDPVNNGFNNIKFWHVDNLLDHYKIMIPLDNVCKNTAPMFYLPGTHIFNSLTSQIKSKYHNMYKNIGLSTSVINMIEDCIIDTQLNKQSAKKLTLKQWQLCGFNTRIIHTGSNAQKNRRRTITLHLNTESKRNQILKRVNN